MDQKDITKLITYIEENLRSSFSSGLGFVDTRHFLQRLCSKQNHVIFGRRGAGKTSLVNATRNSMTHLDVYINLERYKDITFPNILIFVLHELFSSLREQISNNYPLYRFSFLSWKVRKRINTICKELEAYVYEPDREIQEVRITDSSSSGVNAQAGIKNLQSGAKTTSYSSKEIKKSLPKDKLDFLRIKLSIYIKLLSEVSSLFSNKPIFLVLDDLYFINKDIQPDLIDYFHRITKETALYLKIATIKY